MRGGARVAPDRRPEDERDAARRARRRRRPGARRGPTSPATTARKRPDAASRPTRALARAHDGERQRRSAQRAAVAHAAADEREHDVLGRVQRGERAVRKAGAWLVTNRTGRGSPLTAAPSS